MASIEMEPMAVTKGNFKGLAHETKGLASIYQLADGKRTLRLTEFETSNGPDVHDQRPREFDKIWLQSKPTKHFPSPPRLRGGEAPERGCQALDPHLPSPL